MNVRRIFKTIFCTKMLVVPIDSGSCIICRWQHFCCMCTMSCAFAFHWVEIAESLQFFKMNKIREGERTNSTLTHCTHKVKINGWMPSLGFLTLLHRKKGMACTLCACVCVPAMCLLCTVRMDLSWIWFHAYGNTYGYIGNAQSITWLLLSWLHTLPTNMQPFIHTLI